MAASILTPGAPAYSGSAAPPWTSWKPVEGSKRERPQERLRSAPRRTQTKKRTRFRGSAFLMPPVGVEPTYSGFSVQRLNQLSYSGVGFAKLARNCPYGNGRVAENAPLTNEVDEHFIHHSRRPDDADSHFSRQDLAFSVFARKIKDPASIPNTRGPHLATT